MVLHLLLLQLLATLLCFVWVDLMLLLLLLLLVVRVLLLQQNLLLMLLLLLQQKLLLQVLLLQYQLLLHQQLLLLLLQLLHMGRLHGARVFEVRDKERLGLQRHPRIPTIRESCGRREKCARVDHTRARAVERR